MRVTPEIVERYILSLKSEFPSLVVHQDKPWWLKVVFSLPYIRDLKWEEATQTIGMHIYLSTVWEDYSSVGKMCTLRHERQHLLQFKKYGLVLMSFLYLFVFFPIGLSYFRAKFERAGFAESLKAHVEYYGNSDKVRSDGLDTYLRVFLGSKYLWMCPFNKVVSRWFEEDWNAALR